MTNDSPPYRIMNRWHVVQHELLPELEARYDLMDAAYCSLEIREDSRSLGHVPLIDHNPRKGTKIEFDPAEAICYNERSTTERSNARLKDEFGGNPLMVRGAAKVMNHLMFGVLVLSADQLIRLRQ